MPERKRRPNLDEQFKLNQEPEEVIKELLEIDKDAESDEEVAKDT